MISPALYKILDIVPQCGYKKICRLAPVAKLDEIYPQDSFIPSIGRQSFFSKSVSTISVKEQKMKQFSIWFTVFATALLIFVFWNSSGTMADPMTAVGAFKYGVRAHPAHYLINGNGEMVASILGARDWASTETRNLTRFLLDQDPEG